MAYIPPDQISAARLKAIGSAVPGASTLTPRANQLISSMLTGDESPSRSIRDAAYFGVGSGMPGSELAQRFGYDLYGRRREARQQQGIQDLLSFLSQERQDQALGLQAAGQEADDAARDRSQDFQELAWGIGRPFSGQGTTNQFGQRSGQFYDRAGNPLEAYGFKSGIRQRRN